MEAINNKIKFINQINFSFGSGGMTCGFENNQLVEYFQYLLRSNPDQLPVKQGVLSTGMQPDGSCILNANTFISSAGVLMDPKDSPYVWVDKECIGDTEKIRTKDISPRIVTPLSVTSLADLIATLEIILKHNFLPGLIVVSGAIMAFHFSTIKEMFGGCPITVAIGESETGKSTTIRAALSLFGCHQISRYVKGTNALFIERASKSSLPFGIEEAMPMKKGKANKLDLTELVIDLFDGSISANMKTGALTPKTVPVMASNFELEEIDR